MNLPNLDSIPLSAPHRRFQDEDFLSELISFIKTGPYLNGNHVERFEREFASYIGKNFCIGVSSGTAALDLSLMVLDLPLGSEILLPANAGGYASAAAIRNGLHCKYYDVNEFGLPSIELLDTYRTEETKVIVVTHLYGQSADIIKLSEWASNCGIILIEDCAQSAGARTRNLNVGSFGLLSTFSFYPTKNLGTIGDAGAICTDDEALAKSLIRRRQYGWTKRYVSTEPGSNLRMDELHALVLRRELPKLDIYNETRRKIWKRYLECLDEYNLKSNLLGSNDSSFVAHLAVLTTERRDQASSFLTASGISNDVHYPVPDYRQPTYMGTPNAILENTERLCNSVISIPIFESMTEYEISRVCQAIRELCSRGLVAK